MSPPNQTAGPMCPPPPSGVAVRMYNPGFGDCLLLAFRAEDGGARYMLIDCGVHHQYPNGRERAQAVAADIAQATNHRLHLVVATHEHTDHLSGFDYARDIFDGIEIEDLWLAWTEDPNDEVAGKLKKRDKMRIAALEAVVTRLKGAREPLGTALEKVLGFEYTRKKPSPLEYLRAKSRRKLLRPGDYRRPGEAPLTLPGVKGVKIYVLGPPRDKKWISQVQSESDLYPELTALDEVDAFGLGALRALEEKSLGATDQALFRKSCPFDDPALGLAADDVWKHPDFGKFFQERYGSSTGGGPEWRRLEADWLATSEQLALKINNKTNNTSLVLAIELSASSPRKVLLFAADAQAGNWLSWNELSWPGQGEGGAAVNAEDLLRRTVLYKVGHHGSHNATMSAKGLERMASPDLVAMIPVDQKWANEKMEWQHPAAVLLGKITDRTRGRILRSDQIPRGSQAPPAPPGTPTSEWQAFTKDLDWDRDRDDDPLWVQYTVT